MVLLSPSNYLSNFNSTTMTTPNSTVLNIAVADDHALFRKGLINLIQQTDPRFKVIFEAENGREFLAKMEGQNLPDIALLDVNMPIMDGFELTAKLREKFPKLKILALTMLNDEATLIKLLRAGVNGHLTKDIDPDELQTALQSLAENGYYYTERVSNQLVNVIREPLHSANGHPPLTDQEMKFLELACSELTYKMIADQMCLSIKTVDGYRGRLFEKLDVKSRVGMVLYALNNNLVNLESLPA